MLNIIERLILPTVSGQSASTRVDDYLELPFDLRQRSRLRVTLKSGVDAALMLDRGSILRGGDLLLTDNGLVVKVIAAAEPVHDVLANSPQALMCAAYHLGNRHVPLQVGTDWLRLEQDHVLKDMLLGLGMQVSDHYAAFEPEAGAYGGGHRHTHDDGVSIRPRLKVSRHAY